jgi:pyruvate, orthophosphate dikinase
MSSMADAPVNVGTAELYSILRGSALAQKGAEEVGNKAWNMMRMARAGLPVPPAFVLPTAWCGRTDAAAKLPEALAQGVRLLEGATHHAFGGARRPLLVSVRSGAAVSMPGMMETVLDVGLNAETVEALIRETGNPRLAWDSYRRLVQGYAEVVAGFSTAPFDALVAAAVAAARAESERELDHRDLRTLTRAMLSSYRDLAGEPFPADPGVQLLAATQAVLLSWDNGLRQCRRRVRRRGGLLPQPRHRRARALF